MTKQKAHEQGLSFTGIYSWDKEAVKRQLAEIRIKYSSAHFTLVREPPDPLSRGQSSGGYSVYADSRYSALREVEECTQKIANHPNRLASLKIEYDKKVAEEMNCQQSYIERHANARSVLNA